MDDYGNGQAAKTTHAGAPRLIPTHLGAPGNPSPANSLNGEQRQRDVVAQLPLLDWPEVSPGQYVSLYKKGHGHFHGKVDDLTPDGAIVWVHLADGRGRRMFAQADGYQLRPYRSGTASVQNDHTS